MRRRSRTQRTSDRRSPGFTMVELLVVLAIIGIILAFIMSAAMDGVRRAEERATQALITKLELGMADRVDAVVATRADAYPSHQYLSGVWFAAIASYCPPPPLNMQSPFGTTAVPGVTNPTLSNNRAQILARFDQVRAELPDVFFVQQADTNYPVNFAAVPFPTSAGSGLTGFVSGTSADSNKTPYAFYLLPFGVGVLNDPAGASGTQSFGGNPWIPFPYTFNTAPSPAPALIPTPAFNPPSTGIFGASYTAAAGLYKPLFDSVQRINPGIGLPTPRNAGFDGVDNNNNGLIDEITENDILVGTTKTNNQGLPPGTKISQLMVNLLSRHTHKTARAEMLYATLVGGQGPFGSVFSPDDFSDSEVRDTDNDGLPEFVDAWGEPLQYFRWPIFHQSDTQRGPGFYLSAMETRDLNTLDPNQTLVDPSWWGGTFNANSPFGKTATLNATSSLSGGAVFFQSYFHSLTDPNTNPGLSPAVATGQGWDRGSSASPFFARREYYSRYLILSGGQDKTPGVPILDSNYFLSLGVAAPGNVIGVGGTGTFSVSDLMVESQAAQGTPARSGPFYSFNAVSLPPNAGAVAVNGGPSDPVSIDLREAGSDDITNQNLSAPGGATQ